MHFSDALSLVHSQQGRKTIARNALFGAIGSLRALVTQMEGMTKAITVLESKGYTLRAENIRNSTRYIALEKNVQERASRAQGIYAIASASFDLMPEFEPGVPKHLSQEQLAQIAEFSGMSLEKVIELRNNAADKKYRSEMEAMSMTEAMFWSAEADEEPDVKAESVLRALTQTINFIATWSSPDFAELGVLKHDVQIIETIAAKEMDLEERAGELGINEDGTGARSSKFQRQEETAE
jgi:hypothetical protein